MTIPTTYEELVEALRELADKWTAAADRIEANVDHYPGGEWSVAVRRDDASEVLTLLPDPIKVGDWVRGVDGAEGEVLGGPWDDNGDQTCAVRMDNGEGIDLWCVDDLTRVTDEQPEPEPECEWCHHPGVMGCGEVAAGFLCTRPDGHDGVHIACTNTIHDLARSPTPPTTPTWRESRDAGELAAAVAEGKRVEWLETWRGPNNDEWRRGIHDGRASTFAVGIANGTRYRIQDGAS